MVKHERLRELLHTEKCRLSLDRGCCALSQRETPKRILLEEKTLHNGDKRLLEATKSGPNTMIK